MTTYVSKPVEIEAIQWTGDNDAEIIEFTENGFNVGVNEVEIPSGEVIAKSKWGEVYDYLQNTWVSVNLNDYIIKGTEDEFYPCAESVFNRKYEEKKQTLGGPVMPEFTKGNHTHTMGHNAVTLNADGTATFTYGHMKEPE